MKELWKDIPDFNGIYQISNLGRVKSLARLTRNGVGYRKVRERIKPSHCSPALGYRTITLKNVAINKERRYYIHRLVAEAFLPNPNNLPEVNHMDSDRGNATVSNLEWVTPSQNMRHSYANNRVGAWTGKTTKIAIPTIAIQDTAIIEFDSAIKCAEYFNVCLNTVRKRMETGYELKGHLIYELCPR